MNTINFTIYLYIIIYYTKHVYKINKCKKIKTNYYDRIT